MDWEGQRESDNIEDRRGFPAGRTAVVGGGVGTLVIALIYMFMGGDPNVILDGAQPEQAPPAARQGAPLRYQESPGEARQRHFVAVVLADTEDVWHAMFQAVHREYREPKLVLYSGAVDSGCGYAQAAMGPFYCARDERVFLDLSFFDELANRFGARGEFARAYVVAHEVGHHVQNLLGISEQVRTAQSEGDQVNANALSVRLELQADCLAGVWANQTQAQKHVLETGDIESALSAASAVGDDRLQRAAGRRVAPDSFTHGSSEQRVRWFKRGLAQGAVSACDTFAARPL